MAKKINQKNDIYDLKGIDIIELMESHTNNKGKIVGTKKEKKVLKDCCCHFLKSKKGKLKPRTELLNKQLRCRTCGNLIRPSYYSDNEVDKRFDAVDEVLSQGQLVAVASGAGNKVLQNFAEAKMHNRKARNDYKKVRNIAEKNEKSKKQKKNKKTRPSNSFSGWRPSR